MMIKPRVLMIVDSLEIVSLDLRQTLDNVGHTTELILGSELTLEQLISIEPDVILLHIDQPTISETIPYQSFKSDERLKRIPVIALVACKEIADRVSPFADIVLVRPVNHERLANLLSLLCSIEKPTVQTPWDELTGFYTASYLIARLNQAIQKSLQNGMNDFVVFSISLDPFKKTEKRVREADWQRVLLAAAKAIKKVLRATDIVSRFESEKFLVLIENVLDRQASISIAERMQARLDDFLANSGYKSCPNISIGVLFCNNEYKTSDEVLHDTQLAVEMAQKNSRSNSMNLGKASFPHTNYFVGNKSSYPV